MIQLEPQMGLFHDSLPICPTSHARSYQSYCSSPQETTICVNNVQPSSGPPTENWTSSSHGSIQTVEWQSHNGRIYLQAEEQGEGVAGERWGRRHTFGSPLSSSADLQTAKTTVYQCYRWPSNQSFLWDGEVGESMIIEIIIVLSNFYVVII